MALGLFYAGWGRLGMSHGTGEASEKRWWREEEGATDGGLCFQLLFINGVVVRCAPVLCMDWKIPPKLLSIRLQQMWFGAVILKN